MYRSGDYRFHTPQPTNLGEFRIQVTDSNGTYCGHFYVDSEQRNNSDELKILCNTWVTETDEFEGSH